MAELVKGDDETWLNPANVTAIRAGHHGRTFVFLVGNNYPIQVRDGFPDVSNRVEAALARRRSGGAT